MYTKFLYEDISTSTPFADFLQNPTPPGYMCLTACHMEITSSSTDRPRMESNASWPTFQYYKGILVYLECDILADNPTDFATFWHGTINAIMPGAVTFQTSRLQGRLRIRPVGFSEDMLLPVVISEAPAMPRGGLSPSAGQMTMTFKGFRPYWVGATTNTNYWHV